MPTAIITGATKGIGKAIADIFINNGFDIAICARNEKDLKDLQHTYHTHFPNAKVYTEAVDVADKKAIKAFGQNAMTALGGTINVLVNNAGVYFPGDLMTEEEGVLEQMLATNLTSAYHLSRAIVPQMKVQKQGHIFNICSVASLKEYPGGGAYSVSKFALLGFSDNLRHELKAEGIKVTAVCPGAVWSNSWEGSGVDPERIMIANDVAQSIWSAYNLSAQAVMERIVLRPQLGDL